MDNGGDKRTPFTSTFLKKWTLFCYRALRIYSETGVMQRDYQESFAFKVSKHGKLCIMFPMAALLLKVNGRLKLVGKRQTISK